MEVKNKRELYQFHLRAFSHLIITNNTANNQQCTERRWRRGGGNKKNITNKLHIRHRKVLLLSCQFEVQFCSVQSLPICLYSIKSDQFYVKESSGFLPFEKVQILLFSGQPEMSLSNRCTLYSVLCRVHFRIWTYRSYPRSWRCFIIIVPSSSKGKYIRV